MHFKSGKMVKAILPHSALVGIEPQLIDWNVDFFSLGQDIDWLIEY